MVQEGDRASDEGVGSTERLPDVKPKAKRPKPVPVQVVGQEGVALLVQWVVNDDLARCVVPREEYDPAKGAVDKAALDAGLAWGVLWENVDGISLEVAKALRRRGIFTRKDLLARSHMTRAAVMVALVPPAIKALVDFAKEKED